MLQELAALPAAPGGGVVVLVQVKVRVSSRGNLDGEVVPAATSSSGAHDGDGGPCVRSYIWEQRLQAGGDVSLRVSIRNLSEVPLTFTTVLYSSVEQDERLDPMTLEAGEEMHLSDDCSLHLAADEAETGWRFEDERGHPVLQLRILPPPPDSEGD